MQVLPIERGLDRIAELKLQIIQQRQLAAELFRQGAKEGARAARWKLFALLNELDLISEA